MRLLFSDVLYMLVRYASPSGPMCLRCLMLTLSGLVELLFLLCFIAAKSTVKLITPDPKQAKNHPKIIVADTEQLIARSPKILGVHLDASLALHKHCEYILRSIQELHGVSKKRHYC